MSGNGEHIPLSLAPALNQTLSSDTIKLCLTYVYYLLLLLCKHHIDIIIVVMTSGVSRIFHWDGGGVL